MNVNRSVIRCAVLFVTIAVASGGESWSAAEIELLQSFSMTELTPVPADPTNRFADEPRAVALGERLFFDARLSADGRVSCGTCHQPHRGFQDGVALATGVGTTTRRTMPIAAASRSQLWFWDGRKDSLWAQALAPLESAVEHGGSRGQYAHVIAGHYAREYEDIFGALPDLTAVPPDAGPVNDPAAAAAWTALDASQRDDVTRIFVNVGKAIAAYERQIEYRPSRFDRFVDSLAGGRDASRILSSDEVAGLRLFIGKAACSGCHHGPLLTNNDFHNTGVPGRPELPKDAGLLSGTAALRNDEFSCKSRWSDRRDRCPDLEFPIADDYTPLRAFKVPSLRNVAERPPYMHAGQIGTLAGVLDHYNRAPAAPAGFTEVKPLHLQPSELHQLEAFLRTLSGPTARGDYFTSSRSTSNTRVAFGGITPAAPRAP